MAETLNPIPFCRCCHKNGDFKCLFSDFIYENEIENYSQMLFDTFDILFVPALDDKIYTICDKCIEKLRISTEFKNCVLSCKKNACWRGHCRARLGGGTAVTPHMKQETSEDEDSDTSIINKVSHEECNQEVKVEESGNKSDETSSVSEGPIIADDIKVETEEIVNDEDSSINKVSNEESNEESEMKSNETFSDAESSSDDKTICENVYENAISEAVEPPTEPRRCTRLGELQGMISTYTEEIHSAPTNDGDRQKTTRIRIRDYCLFCETDVLNFSRHLQRSHQMEPEVQKILSYPKNSSIRKNLFTSLRKKGNYINNVSKCVKPMKKSKVNSESEYLPCQKCLGFYSRKQLWKHKKTCSPLETTSNAQVNAQNFMLRKLNVDSKLKSEVFPKMRPDKISLEAKKDPIICAFGSQYLRMHRGKHFIYVTSRKMRELAKLLIEIKKLKPPVGNLMDCLKPQNYDIIVTATKKVSSYDPKADRYGAPTYAMNIGTSLKQCCNIAIIATLKSGSSVSTATKEADFKTLIRLIEANWKFDISSQASSDLNLKKWNKITIVPSSLCEKDAIASSKLASSETSNVEA